MYIILVCGWLGFCDYGVESTFLFESVGQPKGEKAPMPYCESRFSSRTFVVRHQVLCSHSRPTTFALWLFGVEKVGKI